MNSCEPIDYQIPHSSNMLLHGDVLEENLGIFDFLRGPSKGGPFYKHKLAFQMKSERLQTSLLMEVEVFTRLKR